MATIREWLDEAHFDWKTAKIVYQPIDEDSYCPGWGMPGNAMLIDERHSILDFEFDTSFGAPQCPRFIAEDSRAYYFPCQYDGSTWLGVVMKDIEQYLNYRENETPYPGS